jgi:hypothetical protein
MEDVAVLVERLIQMAGLKIARIWASLIPVARFAR